MSLLDKITDFVGGGLFKEAKELIKDYWTPDLSPGNAIRLRKNWDQSYNFNLGQF